MQGRHPLPKRKHDGQSAAVIALNAANADVDELGFYIEYMPVARIKRRTLHPYSVHYSLPSSCWIATVFRPSDSLSELHKPRYSQFEFASEKEAKQFCKAYSPPKMDEPGASCFICKEYFTAKQRHFNCRNCGVCVCEKCCPRWVKKGLPKTYFKSDYQATTVRCCKSCIWISNSFCFSLLKGRYQDVLKLYQTGNVNLRTSFADIRGESMFPVHCCTLGGNLELLKWLVEKKGCPISVKRNPKNGKMLSVTTSSGKTLIDLAMTGKPKLDILMYLIQKGLSVLDLADNTLTGRTLEALLKSGFVPSGPQAALVDTILGTVDPSEGSIATVENAVSSHVVAS
jgi:FYVE zinc finger